MAAAGVEFAHVSFALADGRQLIRDINLELVAGTTTALLGRSGSGKTTLLRMVNALVTPTAGEVRVGGISAAASVAAGTVTALRRRIGYVIQESGLFPHITVERNVGMALELAGVRERAARVAEVLALAGLPFEEFAGRYPWQVSGGQRQRVGLARALAGDPDVLLMDEPFGALDPMTRAEMQTMLHELLLRVRKTALLVTHDLDEALYLAERIVFLEAGQMVADLPSGEVMRSNDSAVKAYVSALRRGGER